VTVRAIVYTSRPLADSQDLGGVPAAVAVRTFVARGVERVLAQGEPSPAALDAARRLLEGEVDRPLLLAAYRGDRATVADTVRALEDGRLSRDDVARRGRFPTARPVTGQPVLDHWLGRLLAGRVLRTDATAALRHYTWLVECLKQSPDGLRARAAEWAALRARLPQAVRDGIYPYDRYDADLCRDEAPFRAAVAVLAAERFRRAEGRWPGTLDELVPQYLAGVPRDPFDLGPLKLAGRPDGIVIYSVGPDGKDDGGAVWQEGNRTGNDLGVRLWDVDRRRQPPPATSGAGKNL
jgi:hypothetical protein